MNSTPIIPGYELYTRLGGGLLTSVYSGREIETDTPCAVKLIRPDWDDPVTAMKLLQREARAYFAVQHRFLPSMRFAHVLKPPHFLVMNLLEGESLRRRLRRDYRLDVPEAVWICRQVAQALVALHRKGFIHGDIKPDNIHLTKQGNAVLLDLGFTHRTGENAQVLGKGYILGTVDYLAPEQCGGEPTDDLKSDLFSLGVTLYEMLTGNLPYPKDTVRNTLQKHANDMPIPIIKVAPWIPKQLAHLVMRLLSLRGVDRPKTALVEQQLIGLEIATMTSQLVA